MPAKTNGKLVNQTELAAILGVSDTTVRAWQRKGCPVHAPGRKGHAAIYNTADVVEWRTEHAIASIIADTAQIDFEEGKRRKIVAEAALAEMDLAIRKAEFVAIEEVGTEVEREYASVRANLTAMPGELAADLEGQDAGTIEELLAGAVAEILEELALDSEFAVEEETIEGADDGAEAESEAEPPPVG